MSPDPTFALSAPDRLGVLSSTLPVAREGAWVRLDAAAAAALARRFAAAAPPAHGEDAFHATFLPPRCFLNYLLVLEALNFCFWDDAPRWRVRHGGGLHDGYWALAAALHRALTEDGTPLWDADWMAGLTAPALAHLLRGEGRPPPLLAERLAHVREAGAVLRARWGGWFANLVAACGGDAVALVERIVAEFPSFRDVAAWQGRPVRFYKRAQICAADLARLLGHDPAGRLHGLEHLTAFADYKVPQVLRAEGVLVPAPALAARIDRGEELPAGSPEEVALRAATVWGCEWIARALHPLRGADGRRPTAAEVDFLLWSAGQRAEGMPPYHRTRTVFY